MSNLDRPLDSLLAPDLALREAIEQDLLTGSLLTPPNSSQTTYRAGTEPSLQQTYHWLAKLARQLEQGKVTEFSIDKMQPSWLETTQQKWLYQILIGLITGLIVALIYVGTTGLIGASIGGLSYGVILALTNEIYPITRLKFSLEFAKTQLFSSVLEGLWWGVIYGIIDALICWLLLGFKWLFLGMADSVVWGLIEGFIWGLFVPAFPHPKVSNQVIRESALNAGIFTVIGGLVWVVLYSGVLLAAQEPLEPLDLLIDGIGNGVFFGIYVGGLACLQHFVLRLLLKQSGAIPWNYGKFLDYATELGFLKREGGRYQFINDSVQNYFAQLPLYQTSKKSKELA
jgi:hypothetical protein